MINFTKMVGLGNDFVVISDLENKIANPSQLAKKICDRRFGIGGDGLILLRKTDQSELKMDYLNIDGSHAAMCGNGLRCFGKFAYDQNLATGNKFTALTDDGRKKVEIFGNRNETSSQVKIEMGTPLFSDTYSPWENIWDYPILNNRFRLYLAQVGVPHGVIFAPNGKNLVENYGSTIEKLNLFPKGINVNFVEIIDEKNIKVFTWERGAGHTLACGTGCCACAFVANQLNLTGSEMTVHAEGGDLEISIIDNAISMKAEAKTVGTGVFYD